MNQRSDDELIDCYLNWYRTRREEYGYAWEEVDKKRSPNDLQFICKLIQACRNDAEIAYVAAGPLRDLFSAHSGTIKNSLDPLVRQHVNMRKAIQALLFSTASSERRLLDELLSKYGLKYASL